ncbi:hypothetical protein [Photobacterium alginatilyticum]|nr:hypothetical protein [Photobacterium alginatilyticum]
MKRTVKHGLFDGFLTLKKSCYGKVVLQASNICRFSMIRHAILTLLLLGASTSSLASPELLSPSEIQFGQFELIETIEIQGDIEDSLLRLVDKNLQYKDSDFYVIQDISEDARKDTLTVVVNLYNQSANYSLSQHPV